MKYLDLAFTQLGIYYIQFNVNHIAMEVTRLSDSVDLV